MSYTILPLYSEATISYTATQVDGAGNTVPYLGILKLRVIRPSGTEDSYDLQCDTAGKCSQIVYLDEPEDWIFVGRTDDPHGAQYDQKIRVHKSAVPSTP